MSTDRLIAVEGPENTGKTTVAQALAKALSTRGVSSQYMSFPGRETTSIGRIVYEMDHEPGKFGIGKLHPASRQVLHLAAHIDAIENRIKPALAKGDWVVLDRYWWSMWAHGIAQGVPADLLGHLMAIEAAAWMPIKPAMIVTTLRPFPYHEEATSEWHAVKEAYARLTEREARESNVIALDPGAELDDRVKSCLACLTTRGLLGPTA